MTDDKITMGMATEVVVGGRGRRSRKPVSAEARARKSALKSLSGGARELVSAYESDADTMDAPSAWVASYRRIAEMSGLYYSEADYAAAASYLSMPR